MRHFRSWTEGVAACGAKVGKECCFARHAAVTCRKCLVILTSLSVKCSHPDCSWKGSLSETRMTVTKRRCCPQCVAAGTWERPNVNYVVDEFGTQVVLLPPVMPTKEEDDS